jgi:hypothetical protein
MTERKGLGPLFAGCDSCADAMRSELAVVRQLVAMSELREMREDRCQVAKFEAARGAGRRSLLRFAWTVFWWGQRRHPAVAALQQALLWRVSLSFNSIMSLGTMIQYLNACLLLVGR